MNSIIRLVEPFESLALPTVRPELSAWLRRTQRDLGADHYLLLDLSPVFGASDARLIASNWDYDAVQDIGIELMARIALAPVTPFLGAAAAAIWQPLSDGCHRADLCEREARALDDTGLREISGARLRIDGDTYCVLFSAEAPGSIAGNRLLQGMMSLSYALSSMARNRTEPLQHDPLSERERECLHWAAEGKTTDELSTIVGVTANTVNGYITHAMRKLGAANRAMAIAMAIRGGII